MNSLDDYSVNELCELHISQNNEESIPWFTRTIMGGLTTNNAVIDARQEIEGEANPNFGGFSNISKTMVVNLWHG